MRSAALVWPLSLVAFDRGFEAVQRVVKEGCPLSGLRDLQHISLAARSLPLIRHFSQPSVAWGHLCPEPHPRQGEHMDARSVVVTLGACLRHRP